MNMGRIKYRATRDFPAEPYETWRNGIVAVTVTERWGKISRQEAAFLDRLEKAFGSCAVFKHTSGDGRWTFYIGDGDQSEGEDGSERFWELADDWLEDRSPLVEREMNELFREEWEGRITEEAGPTEDIDIRVEVNHLRIWER